MRGVKKVGKKVPKETRRHTQNFKKKFTKLRKQMTLETKRKQTPAADEHQRFELYQFCVLNERQIFYCL